MSQTQPSFHFSSFEKIQKNWLLLNPSEAVCMDHFSLKPSQNTSKYESPFEEKDVSKKDF